MNLRDSIVIQSLFRCISNKEIDEIIRIQPSPDIFATTYFELFKSNLVTILSFDSIILKQLLGEIE